MRKKQKRADDDRLKNGWSGEVQEGVRDRFCVGWGGCEKSWELNRVFEMEFKKNILGLELKI